MKYTFTLITFIVLLNITGSALAQDNDPKFGKYTAEEQNMTFCTFEPEADAVVLFESGSSSFLAGNLLTQYHVRKKLFNHKYKDFGDVTIRYYHGKDGQESINGIKAQTVNWVNGKMEVTKLTKDEIFEVDAVDGYKEYRLVFPNVKEGSIIEYSYKKTDKNITFPDGWYFQNYIPTITSKYSISIPHYLDYQSWSQGINLISNQAKPKIIRDSYIWELNDLRSIRPEPYLSNFVDYLDKIQFQLEGYKTKSEVGGRIDYKKVLSSWEESANDILKIGVVAGYLKSNSNTRFLKEIPFKAVDKLDLLYQIETYIQHHYETTTTSGIIPSIPIKEISQQKKANKAAVNYLLIALLKENDIEAYPLLISSKGNGRSKLVQYPFVSQFNQMIVQAEIDGNTYYLDGATKGLTPGYLALDNHVDHGFLLKEEESGLVPIILNHRSGRTLKVKINVNEDRQLIFDTHSRYNDYDAFQLKSVMGEDMLSDKAQEKYFANIEKTIKDFSIQATDGNHQQINVNYISVEDIKDQSENLMVMPFNNLRFKENPFKDDIRLFPVDFNFTFNDYYVVHISIPDGYELDDFPENTAVALPENKLRFSYSVVHMANELVITSNLNLRSRIIQPDEYLVLKSFMEVVLSKYSEPVILKKRELSAL